MQTWSHPWRSELVQTACMPRPCGAAGCGSSWLAGPACGSAQQCPARPPAGGLPHRLLPKLPSEVRPAASRPTAGPFAEHLTVKGGNASNPPDPRLARHRRRCRLRVAQPVRVVPVGSGYAARRVRRGVILMHREIMNAPPGKDVDHFNGHPSDNRRHNLRISTLIREPAQLR